MVGLLAIVAGVSACTGGSGSPGPSSTSGPPPIAVPLAFPGLTTDGLIAKMKTAVGPGAAVTYSTAGSPAGEGSYGVNPDDHKIAPGGYLVVTKADDQIATRGDSSKVVYSFVCESEQRGSGVITPVLRVCTDLPVKGMDNAQLRAWVGATRPITSTITKQFGPVRVALTRGASELDIVLSYVGTP